MTSRILALSWKVYGFPRPVLTKCHIDGELRTTDIYSVVVLETEGLKSGCPQSYAPCKTCREFLPCFFPASAGLLAIFGIPLLVNVSLQSCLHMTFSLCPSSFLCGCLLLHPNSSFFKAASHIAF